jgi:hypothetical protein
MSTAETVSEESNASFKEQDESSRSLKDDLHDIEMKIGLLDS